LRKAGATTRIMLVSAAAAQWNVPAAECRVDNGQVIHGENTIGFGALAAAASKQPVPQNVTLKLPAEFRGIGKPRRGWTGPTSARGRTVFGLTRKQPWHGVCRPPPLSRDRRQSRVV
jgi:isoquinoline 1-oxidoreductase beta subunit